MKIVMAIGQGTNQRALACRMNQLIPLDCVYLETFTTSVQKYGFMMLVNKVLQKLFTSSVDKAWFNLMDYYGKRFPDFNGCKVKKINSVNDEEFINELATENPDLIIVSGTSLLRKRILALKPSKGIINLHTGLSPYIKGGPNCTNWCLAKGDFHLIGNTIMWIDEGIDSGNIIATELTEFSGKETLTEIHVKVMEHAHDLYLRSVKAVIAGRAGNIKQNEIAKGSTFYTKQWGLSQRLALLKNLKKFERIVNSSEYNTKRNNVRVFPLQEE